jgi:hypothetical protein
MAPWAAGLRWWCWTASRRANHTTAISGVTRNGYHKENENDSVNQFNNVWQQINSDCQVQIQTETFWIKELWRNAITVVYEARKRYLFSFFLSFFFPLVSSSSWRSVSQLHLWDEPPASHAEDRVQCQRCPCGLCAVPTGNFKSSVMRRLTTGMRSEKCVVRRFRLRANVIECTSTNLDSTV